MKLCIVIFKFHLYIKSLLDILRCYTAIPSLHFFFETLIFENNKRQNLTKYVFYIFKNGTHNKYLYILKICVWMTYNLQLYFLPIYQLPLIVCMCVLIGIQYGKYD